MASGVAWPNFSSSSFSRLPPLTPMRMGMPFSPAFSTTAFTRSWPPMLPGLMRRQAAPPSAAIRASR